MITSPKSAAVPRITFDSYYPPLVQRLYRRIINHTMIHYWRQLKAAPPGLVKDPFLEPIECHVVRVIPQDKGSKEWLGDLAGVADETGVRGIELDRWPNLWTANRDCILIGHEFGHTLFARVLSGLPYKWGQVGHVNYGGLSVNYTHYIQGLLDHRNDSRYIIRKRLLCNPLVGGLAVANLAIFDIVGLLKNRGEVDADIKTIESNPTEKRKWRL